jgi:hypothetical protein
MPVIVAVVSSDDMALDGLVCIRIYIILLDDTWVPQQPVILNSELSRNSTSDVLLLIFPLNYIYFRRSSTYTSVAPGTHTLTFKGPENTPTMYSVLVTNSALSSSCGSIKDDPRPMGR